MALFSNPKIKIIFIVLGFAGALACISILIVGPSPDRNTDFASFWTAGYMARHGMNPYNSAQWLATRHQFNITWDSDPILPYPLALALFLWPLSFFDYPQAFTIWVFFSLVAVAGSCIILTGHLPIKQRIRLFVPLIASIAIFRPLWVILLYGQIGAFLLFILSLSVVLLKNKRWFWAGCLIALMMLKPSFGLIIVGIVFLWSLWQKRWNLIIGQILTSAVLFLLGWLQDKNWVAETIEYGKGKLVSTAGIRPTIWDWRTFVCGEQGVCNSITLIIIILILFSTYFLWKRLDFRSPSILLGVVTPLALAFTAYIWMYDHVLCILSMLVLMIELNSRNQSFWRIALVPLSLSFLSWVLLAVASTIMQDIWGAALPLACYFFYFSIPPTHTQNQMVAPS